MNDNKLYERYQRQMILKEFGVEGQRKLLRAKVLVIGAGGLGCSALQYLAGAGVGTIGIVDDDMVSLSNLHRQILYSVKDIGFNKAERATEVLQQLNPEIKIIAYPERLTTQNAFAIMEAYDIIIDGTDNFSSRYMINDACVLLNKTFVFGAVSQWEGQVAVFSPHPLKGGKDGVNYRDLFPQPPKDGEVLNCAEAGVIGVLPGIIGTMMANETIKLITGIGSSLINRMVTYNALTNQVYELGLSARKKTRSLIPKDKSAFLQTDYEWLCAAQPQLKEIDVNIFNSMIAKGEVDVIDVREENELPAVKEFLHLKIPLTQLAENISLIKSDTVVAFCQSGKRSLQAAGILSGIFRETKKVYSLKGGILKWKQNQAKLPV